MRASSPSDLGSFARRCISAALVAFFVSIGVQTSAFAQLQVTEVMVDPLDDDVWEWIEVRNLDPNEVDLDGALGDRLGDPRILITDPVSINSLNAANTVIPGGGVAVLYNANFPGVSNADPNDKVFRDAWQLPNSVPLIGVDFFPELVAGGSIGFWENYTAYSMDLASGGGGFVVDNFDNALFSIDLQNAFPTPSTGTSMSWNQQGSYQDGSNWASTQNGDTSVAASVQAPINSTLDFGTPGLQPDEMFRSALTITELMVQPDSDQPQWEWIEIYNGTGAPVDLDGYVLDDTEDVDLFAANISDPSSIPNLGSAVLFNGDALTVEDMQAAWDPNDANGTNFIPVTNFSELATSGTVALWPSIDDYTSEETTGPGRSTDNARTALTYDDDGLNWPSFNGVASNFLAITDADPNAPGYGLAWAQTDMDDPNNAFDQPGFNAAEVVGDVEVHAGGDIGSPGQLDSTIEDADFDDDGDVDGFDFLTWQLGLADGTSHEDGDANKDGVVDGADLDIWEDQYGSILNNVDLDADFDDDDEVDGEDLLAWQRGYLAGSSHGEGDANGDGLVDGADLAIWAAQYGGSPPLVASSQAVPEPSSLCLLALGLCHWIGLSRRRPSR